MVRHVVAAAVLIPAAVGSSVVAAGNVAGAVFEELQAARRIAGAPELERLTDLDRVARERAATIAGLPHNRRLSYAEPIDDRLRDTDVRLYHSAALHVDMVRGFTNTSAAFLRNWHRYDQAWTTAMDPRFDAVGVGVRTASDAWVVLAVVFVDRYATPQDPGRLERRTLEAVNDVRRRHGLPPLLPDSGLADVARAHSADMARRGYFDHETPEGADFADRVLAHGLTFSRVAENIQMSRGVDDPVSAAVESWMASPGHREAILEPAYERTGVGVALADDGTVYFTQLFFTAPPPGVSPRAGPEPR